MKRTLCLSALFVVCATIAVSGQSMNEKLQQLLGGSHSAKQEEATPPTYPSEEALLGVWTYQAPSIEYKGDDMFASIAVAGLQDQLATHYVKAGLVPGQGTVSFEKRNRLHASMGGHEIDGTYSYDPATGTAAITLIQDGKQATFQGYLTLRGEVLTLQFDAGDALEAVRHSSPEYAANEKMQQIASIMQNYPGIMLGGQLKKIGNP